MSDLLTGDIPESPAATKKRTGVTHLNKKPLVAIGIFTITLLCVAAFALKTMGDRQNKTAEEAEEDYSAVKQRNFVDSYLNNRSDGVIDYEEAPKPPAFLNEEPSPIKTVSLQQAIKDDREALPPTPPIAPKPACGTEAQCQKELQLAEAVASEQMRMEMLKRTQLENAANGSMRVNFNRSGDPEVGVCVDPADADCESSAEPKEPLSARDQMMARSTQNMDKMMELVKARMQMGDGGVAPVGNAAAAPMQTGFGVGTNGRGNGFGTGGVGNGFGMGSGGMGNGNVFAGDGMPTQHFNQIQSGAGQQGQSDYLEQELKDPRSETEIKAGTVIRATMLTGINSDLPGQVIGQVTRNVWDSIDSEYVLIPQGARLIGRYESGISFGQKRVLVAWDRLIYPNGQSIRLEGMGGYDKSGQSGYKDKVKNHYMKAFGSAILFSIVSGGVSKVDDQTSQPQGIITMESEFRKELGKQISRLSNKFIDRALNISPTLMIRQGYVMNIMVDRDIVLPPYAPMHDQLTSRYSTQPE